MQGLKELFDDEEQVLIEASDELSQCANRTTSSGSAEAVECHRLLLLASTRAQYFVCTLYSILLGLLRPPVHFDRLTVIKNRLIATAYAVPTAIVPHRFAGRPSLTAVGLSATAVALRILQSNTAIKRNLTPAKNQHAGYMHYNESGGAAGWVG